MLRTFAELTSLGDFLSRFHYLSLRGQVGAATFGYDRWMNQDFYRSTEWRQVRSFVITRDMGCDLGLADHPIYDKTFIHHMNPMTPEQLQQGDGAVLDPEFLITTCHTTHNAIHYGDESLLPRTLVPRQRGDTKLW